MLMEGFSSAGFSLWNLGRMPTFAWPESLGRNPTG
jgi:hypothetical protein